MSQRIDAHQAITDRIIAAIEQGAGESSCPGMSCPVHQRGWSTSSRSRAIAASMSSRWVEAQMRRYSAPAWDKYKHCQEGGCQFRKGDKASLVVFYKELAFDREPEKPGDEAGMDTA